MMNLPFMFLALIGFETCNKFEIKNSLGQRIYLAVEDSDCCTRNCFGRAKPFTLRVLDNVNKEVITIERPLRCDSCCSPCCLQEVSVQPPWQFIKYFRKNFHPSLNADVMIITTFTYVLLLLQIKIQAPPGVSIGYITQTWHLCLPKYTVQNERRENVLKITGPCVQCQCCTDIDFKVRIVIMFIDLLSLCKTNIILQSVTNISNTFVLSRGEIMCLHV